MQNIAIILAGGSGDRMGNLKTPKQFLKINDKPIIIHTITRFLLVKEIDKIIISCRISWIKFLTIEINKAFDKNVIHKIFICNGGTTRNNSTINAVKYIKKEFSLEDAVLITHDAVRPFVSFATIIANIKAYKPGICIDTVIPATDTIVESNDGDYVKNIPIRKIMFLGMTPQTFSMATFEDLYKKINNDVFSDVCGIFDYFKYPIKLVYANKSNIKITTPYDLRLARAIVDIGENND